MGVPALADPTLRREARLSFGSASRVNGLLQLGSFFDELIEFLENTHGLIGPMGFH